MGWIFEISDSDPVRAIFRDAEMTIKIFFERSSQKGGGCRGFEKRVNRGPTLKFYCRPKAQEKLHLGKSNVFLPSLFPRKYSDNNFGQFPPLLPTRGSDWGDVRIRELLLERILVISAPPQYAENTEGPSHPQKKQGSELGAHLEGSYDNTRFLEGFWGGFWGSILRSVLRKRHAMGL